MVGDLDATDTELRALAGSRTDLLGEHAGVCLGWVQHGTAVEALCFRAEAELCIATGADETQIPAWIDNGRRRAEQARLRSYSG